MDFALIAALPWYLDPGVWLSFLKAAAALGFVIFVHELGHFLVAKACGVKCEKFYIGFDFFEIKIGGITLLPRALFKFRWGETEYGIGSIPLGGYVKMLGQEDNPSVAAQHRERQRARLQSPAGAAGGEPAASPAPAGPTAPPGPAASAAADQPAAGEAEFVLDPRSYLAKPVWQRMLIISAGVTMNVIFAVIFATLAYGLGVPYGPCEVGDVISGSPAWEAGLQPGDKLIQLGRGGEPSETLRFDWDLQQAVGLSGSDADFPVLVRRADGTQEWITLRPTPRQVGKQSFPSIGVSGAHTLTLGSPEPAAPRSAASRAAPALQGGDVVTALNGQPLAHGYELKLGLRRAPADQPVTLTVRRLDPQKPAAPPAELQVVVPPNPRRTLGLTMQMGPVKFVQPGSPAEGAGLKPGDRLLTLDGEPAGDPLLLEERLRARAGQEVALGIERPREKGAPEQLTLKLTPERIDATRGAPADMSFGTAPSIGVSYTIPAVIAAVDAGGPAQAAELQPGDKVIQVRFLPPEGATEDEIARYQDEDPLVLGEKGDAWPYVVHLVQALASPVELDVVRDGQSRRVTLAPATGEGFTAERGLLLEPRMEVRQAESFGEAVSLGFRETKEGGERVLMFLRKLVTGEVSLLHTAGPLSIAGIATAKASQGFSSLLIFLTFLSVNLAIVNFLPIPVLDGGHMLFLAYEGIFRKPVDERWQIGLTLVGFAFLVGLMLLVTGIDIWRWT